MTLSPLNLFLALILFSAVVAVVGRKFSAAVTQKFLFGAVIFSTLFLYKSVINRTVVLVVFYLGIVALANKYKSIPRKYFILLALTPLILFKLGDVIPAFLHYKDKIAIVGISYISFRVIQILLDLDGYQPKRFSNVFMFLFNPLTLLAGPIDRFHRFEENIESLKGKLNQETFTAGWYFLLWGIFQKFVLAYFWDVFVMSKFVASSHEIKEIVGTAYSYTVYLFLDFSGYSLMAMGAGYMMGILLPANFDKPWLTKNPKDLWKRFHITLGSFLNDYFFKPIYMALARKSFFKTRRLTAQNIALMLTFLLMGAWNGLKWYYILSGAMFGLASVVYNTYQAKYAKSVSGLLSAPLVTFYRFFFINYVVWALYLFSGKLPV